MDSLVRVCVCLVFVVLCIGAVSFVGASGFKSKGARTG